MPNRLIHEKSPYLLQHAHNPVDWHPWGEEAFAKSRAEDKPIFLSVGYSTCHWCHVMERESFENEGIAKLMNQWFIPVKVDREERPDVDRIYMTYVQASTGGGGWPMSVWLTPDLQPFVGGTYFPPENRWGRPGFPMVLERIAEAWKNDRAKIVASSEAVMGELKRQTEVSGRGFEPSKTALTSAYNALRRSFDSRFGGFGGAPKFPRPSTFNFLLRCPEPEALEMTLVTLRAMAAGGMNDQLGGGFHRYSVDERWFVPHFEKMLYDQAQLAASFVEAWQITHDADLERAARRVIDYVLRDLTSPEGAFFSAEDADSVIDAADPHEKGEGAFYVWAQAEIEAALGAEAEAFCRYYGVRPEGNVSEDPQGEFTGKNILAVVDPGAPEPEGKERLLAARAAHVRPHLDDKILTAWNGLMLSAMAKAGAAFEEPRYLDAARRAAAFLLRTMQRDGVLLRRYRAGDAAIPGFLDDYAFLANGLVDLYEATFDSELLRAAVSIAERMIARFEDAERGGFYSTAEGDPSLVMRIKEDYDGAEPSGNSMAALALLRLGAMLDRDDFTLAATRAISAFESRITGAPVTVPQMLVAFQFSLATVKQIVLAGDARELRREIDRRFLPNRVLLAARDAAWMDAGGETRAFVCEDYTCKLPVSTAAELAALI